MKNKNENECNPDGIFAMDFKMSASDNVTGKPTTTIDLILAGIRKGTTRGNWWDYTRNHTRIPEVGEEILFRSKDGKTALVKVITVHTVSQMKKTYPKEFLKIMAEWEGWTEVAFTEFYNKGHTVNDRATQVIFELVYLVWSFEHRAWWMSNQRGYTTVYGEAGKYNKTEADEIVKKSVKGEEIAVLDGVDKNARKLLSERDLAEIQLVALVGAIKGFTKTQPEMTVVGLNKRLPIILEVARSALSL